MQNRSAGVAAVRRVAREGRGTWGSRWPGIERGRVGRVGRVGPWLRRRSRRLLGVTACVGAVGVLAGGVLWASPWLRLAQIDVHGVEDPRLSATVVSAAGPLGRPLVEVDVQTVASRVAAAGLYARVDVARRWPDALIVAVTPRDPVIALREGAGRLQLVDASGVTYDRVAQAPPGLPELVLDGADAPHAEPLGRAAADAVLAFPAGQRRSVEGLRVDDRGRLTLSVGGVDVVWGDGSRAALKGRVASALITRGGIRAVDVSAPTTPATLS